MPKKNKNTPAETIHPDVPETPAHVEETEPIVAAQTGDLPKSKTPTSAPTVVKSSNVRTGKRLPVWAWVALGVVVLGGVAVAGWMMMGDKTTNTNTVVQNQNTNTAETLVPRQLDGVPVPADKANPNIYAVMIENIAESRPPSGLDEAPVVYEALAEGGITRFLALFPVSDGVVEIGPVRSARPYYISWAEEYKALYVHAGGSPQALTYLRSSQANVYDFNQFTHGPNFWRDKSRFAPHNLYTSTDLLYPGLKKGAPDAVPTYAAWKFKEPTEAESLPATVTDLVIDFSSFNYRATYKYDRTNNQYIRYVGDKEHLTRTGKQITVKNIVIQYTKVGLIAGDKQRLEMEVVGEGRALVVRDGVVIEATWKKPSVKERTRWYDASGNEVAINPGHTWIEIVPTDRKVTY